MARYSGLCILALVSLAVAANAFAFAPSQLAQVTGKSCTVRGVCQQASLNIAKPLRSQLRLPALSMADEDADAPEEVAGVAETTAEEDRSLQKTRTRRRPRTPAKDKKPLTDYEIGSTVSGKVVSIMPYGAFVDIGAMTDGLVHVSQLSDSFVSNIDDVVAVGDEVQVRIAEIDMDKNKISLSMKSEQAAREQQEKRQGGRGGKKEVPEEFKNFDDKLFIDGTVATCAEYGVFVTIAEGVDGLVHVSQISEERVENPSTMFKSGQEVKVRIINFDKQRGRLSLSMREWTEPPPRDETEDIKGWVDPEIEGAKTAFQIAYEKAQSKVAA